MHTFDHIKSIKQAVAGIPNTDVLSNSHSFCVVSTDKPARFTAIGVALESINMRASKVLKSNFNDCYYILVPFK